MGHIQHLLCLLLVFGWMTAAARPAAPVINDQARVKQHRKGARGDLVDGEESLRKVIVQWGSVPNALEYEVCHDCTFDSQTGEPKEGEGVRSMVDIGKTRGGQPVHIVPGARIGINTFHVRARVGTKAKNTWTDWSEPRNFDVHEDTTKSYAEHQEL